MGRTTNMSVCMSNSFPSDVGTLTGLILVCFGKKKKKKKKGRERKEGKRNFSSLPHYPDKSEKQV